MSKKKFSIDPFRWLFYNFVKNLVLISYRIFYSKKTLINGKHLHDVERPAILISNHPSTLMDPMNAAKEINGIVFFLANAGMFATKFTNWFFTTFYAIKIERPKDVNGRRIENKKAFEQCDDFLERRNGVLYIAAEGTSKVERRLRPLKTGAARIAFNAESSSDFKLGLTIIPVSITYENPLKFRKEIILKVAEPIKIADYKEIWEGNARKAIYQLTEDVQSTLQANLLHTEPEDEDVIQLVDQLGIIERNKHQLSYPQLVEQQKKWIAPLVDSKKGNAKGFSELEKQSQHYFEALKTAKLTDESLVRANTSIDWLKLILGFPFFLYGYINNFLAIAIPSLVNKKMDLYPGYYPAVKVVTALITLPFFYWLQAKILSPYFPASYWKWIYWTSLIPLGLLAWNYMEMAKRMFARRRFLSMKDKKVFLEKRKNLAAQKVEIISPTSFSKK